MTRKLIWIMAMGVIAITGCKKSTDRDANRDYRLAMRDLVQSISTYAKGIKPGFLIVPQNGQALINKDGKATSTVNGTYLDAIDGQAVEELYYGYDNQDNVATPAANTAEIGEVLPLFWSLNKRVLVTDYCTDTAKVNDAHTKCNTKGYLSFAANHRGLDDIPTYPSPPKDVNTNNITSLSQAKNYLYLINPENYTTKQDFVNAIAATNYDLVIMDLYWQDEALTASDIAAMHNKANGGKRLLIAYMSIGEAENYRYYWQSSWNNSKPSFLEAENPDWPGNFAARYFEPQWQQIIYGNDGSYTKKILNAGFDGVMLDKVDEYDYFENK